MRYNSARQFHSASTFCLSLAAESLPHTHTHTHADCNYIRKFLYQQTRGLYVHGRNTETTTHWQRKRHEIAFRLEGCTPAIFYLLSLASTWPRSKISPLCKQRPREKTAQVEFPAAPNAENGIRRDYIYSSRVHLLNTGGDKWQGGKKWHHHSRRR